MNLFRYKAFGLNIESQFEIPELIPGSGEPDVLICYGEVPDQLPNPHFLGVRFQASPEHFLLKVDHIASFYAESGHTITVQPLEGSSYSDIRIFLLGSVFGALLHQRGLLPMHGSSLLIRGKAYIFSGVSGAGKSTLAAGLLHRGHDLLNDDISVVGLPDGKIPKVYSGYPGMKLWADSLEKLGMQPELHRRVRAKLDKHLLDVPAKFQDGAFLLGGVYILHTKNTEGIQIEALKGIEKFNALKNNTYRLNFIKGLGNTEAHFTHLSALAMHCQVKKIARSNKGFALDQLLDLIEQDITQNHGEPGQ